MKKKRTTVRIAGRDYNMAGYDSEEYMHRVAQYVDRKMQELSLATRLDSTQLSVLTALNIADDALKAHDQITRLQHELGALRLQMQSAQQELALLRARQDAPAARKIGDEEG